MTSPTPTMTKTTTTPPTTLKLEDLDSTPPPVVVQSKPAKKRKSWGQKLPEPKTALPPRKRAKTQDEKEQRRIERIKRNRAAAHNSRERKRQETETLAVALARTNAELEAYRRLFGPLPASVVLPEVQLCTDDSPAPFQSPMTPVADLDDRHSTADIPTPPLTDSRASIGASSPSSPQDPFELYIPNIKQEDADALFPSDLPDLAWPSGNDDEAKPPPIPTPLDPMQHSAAMLCDLQCRSRWRRGRRRSTTSTWAISSSSTWARRVIRHLLCRTMLHLPHCSRSLPRQARCWTNPLP